MGNAVTHGDSANPIRVALRSNPTTVTVSVQNQGPPIEPALLPILFNPFARGDKPQGPSAGLGYARASLGRGGPIRARG